MKYNVFTLQPQIFDSFLTTSLIARSLNKEIISVNRVDWREEYGVGGYKQVDDKPFGGGSGMVIQPGPIYNALKNYNAVSTLYKKPETVLEFDKTLPNNSIFFDQWSQNPGLFRNITISLTPRGFPINQKIVEWLASEFETVSVLCGRYEGFDHRVGSLVDLELSIGDFILNGGETASMCLIESISRLLPGFVTKSENVHHDSFSTGLNFYHEQSQYAAGKKLLPQKTDIPQKTLYTNLFNNEKWLKNILPNIEHPQYTRPEVWENMKVPDVLLNGNHKLIQDWRLKWWM